MAGLPAEAIAYAQQVRLALPLTDIIIIELLLISCLALSSCHLLALLIHLSHSTVLSSCADRSH